MMIIIILLFLRLVLSGGKVISKFVLEFIIKIILLLITLFLTKYNIFSTSISSTMKVILKFLLINCFGVHNFIIFSKLILLLVKLKVLVTVSHW